LTALIVWGGGFLASGFIVSAVTGALRYDDWGLTGLTFYPLAFIPTKWFFERLIKRCSTPNQVALSALATCVLLSVVGAAFGWLMATTNFFRGHG